MLGRIFIVKFSTVSCLHKEVANNLKGKNKVAQEWIKRQLSDPFVKKARFHNFRCRSAFKLLEIDDRYNILQPGFTVVDCGAAPGSWCQVAAVRTNSIERARTLPVGKVIGIDLILPQPLDGVTFLAPYDFTESMTQEKVREILGGEKANVLLSDMAPNATGLKDSDHEKLVEMLFIFIRFAVMNTKIDGTCLLKIWNGKRVSEIEDCLKKFYENVKLMKPDASRQHSAELYFLARNFKGIKTNKDNAT